MKLLAENKLQQFKRSFLQFHTPWNECPRWRGNLLKFPGHPKILKICQHLCVKVPTKTPVLLWCDGEAPGAWTQTSKKNSKTDRTSASAPKTPPEDSKHSSPMSPTLNNRKSPKSRETKQLHSWQNDRILFGETLYFVLGVGRKTYIAETHHELFGYGGWQFWHPLLVQV